MANSASMGPKLSALVGSAGKCFPLAFQQDPAASGSTTGAADQPLDDRYDPPGVLHYLEQAWIAHHCDRSLSSDQQ